MQLPYAAVIAVSQNSWYNVLKCMLYYIVGMIEITLRVYRVDHNRHYSLQTYPAKLE